MIKAIETWYDGYRFRSRLEARWAVFFDAMDFEYRYELQGYKLDDMCYLPDFYLPGLKTYVEVKPYPSSEMEIEKAERLSIGMKSDVIIVEGDPYFPSAHHFSYHKRGNPLDAQDLVDMDEWFRSKGKRPIDLRHVDENGYVLHFYYSQFLWFQVDGEHFPFSCPSGFEHIFNISPMLIARQARFEHGETPRRG